MQKFLFVNCKGYSMDQAILAMRDALEKIGASEETADLNIHSVQFVPGVEMPKKNNGLSLIDGRPPQPVMVVNCTAVLIEKSNVDIKWLQEKISQLIESDLFSKAAPVVPTAYPSREEIQDLLEAKRFTCQHTTLHPLKYYKTHRGTGLYYQLCADCGAEVWQPGIENIPEVNLGGASKVDDVD
jgi:hypothetical protein